MLELKSFSPTDYVNAINAAEQAGYDILIIDSLTHAWSGKNGALELVDKATARLKSGNSFAAWREVTPLHNQMVDAIMASKLHVIATLRSKTEYVMEEDSRGRKVPRKIGMAPIQRDGLEYEFDVVGDMDWENRLIVTKTRCPELAGAVINRPGKSLPIPLRRGLATIRQLTIRLHQNLLNKLILHHLKRIRQSMSNSSVIVLPLAWDQKW